MTREEAIAWFENWLLDYYDIDDIPQELTAELAGIALASLRQQEHFREVTKNVEPLTLDELRQMDGEPAWFVSLHDGFASRGIVRVVEMSKAWFIAVAGAERAFGDLDGYGKTWLAYRRKVEEGTEPLEEGTV